VEWGGQEQKEAKYREEETDLHSEKKNEKSAPMKLLAGKVKK